MERNGKKLQELPAGARRRLSDARNAWRKMSYEQRVEFLTWLDEGAIDAACGEDIARDWVEPNCAPVARPNEGNADALRELGLAALLQLDADEDWSMDTIDPIAQRAMDLGLATTDECGNFAKTEVAGR